MGSSREWVPQGSVLGPILFLIFINDIGEGVSSDLLVFTNYTKLYRTSLKQEDQELLQQDITKLHTWSKTWQMEFNITKCNVIHFGSKNVGTPYFMDGVKIPQSTSIKDLGVFIQGNGKWESQIKEVTSKCNRLIGQINKAFSHKSAKLMFEMYKTYILPLVDHCVCVEPLPKEGHLGIGAHPTPFYPLHIWAPTSTVRKTTRT